MTLEMVVQLDERVSKYVEAQAEAEHKPIEEVLRSLVQTGYDRELQRLHSLYQQGDITLRTMARQLGISYRELYQLMTDQGLTV
jgi:AraC-like DNA-binding protein